MADSESIPSLSKILGTDVTIDVVDIGANPIDSNPPYQGLLRPGLARVTGFEPNPEAPATQLANKCDYQTYLPDAIADRDTHALQICRKQGTSALLGPNQREYQ